MGRRLSLITPLHLRTPRDYLKRMQDEKVACMRVAREYDREFWDGDRRYGYGGHRYDGRWEPVARRLAEIYRLDAQAKILDVGCGKGYLLYEFKRLFPEALVQGFDLSGYAIQNVKEEVRDAVFIHKAQDPYPFSDRTFDLVLSLGTLHNLVLYDLKAALAEIERVGKQKYVTAESYRDEKELFNLQCWALTCESFFTPEEWVWIFHEFGYSGDYEFIYFE